ncbi:MAG TPA: hypothetical protein DCM71_07975 [Runella sp.]|nr:hypothetical protein [Runella sp.]
MSTNFTTPAACVFGDAKLPFVNTICKLFFIFFIFLKNRNLSLLTYTYYKSTIYPQKKHLFFFTTS